VSLFSDNSTVVDYIRKQGGTHSPVLCRMTWELLQFCRCENIVLVPRHIPGQYNILADALSRSNKLVSTEWTLHMDVVQAIRDLWGSPMIDLFATKINNRLPQYMSHVPDLKALAVNALAISWDSMNAYAFPLTPLIQAVLNKVMTDKVHLCLIAPCWPSQAWFPNILELLTEHPRRLPECDHLLWHPLGKVYHTSPSFYKLHTWKISGASSDENNFLRTLSAASPLLRGGEQLTPISQSGLSTKLGVGKREYIRSFPLFPS
jgi:hypothetical protein